MQLEVGLVDEYCLLPVIVLMQDIERVLIGEDSGEVLLVVAPLIRAVELSPDNCSGRNIFTS